MLRETYRLSLENNKLLHKMRRSAFWGGIIKLVLYVGLLVVVPFWLYMTYLAPVVDQMLNTVEQIQGTGARASAQFDSVQALWQQFQETVRPSQQ